jgi:transaldolase
MNIWNDQIAIAIKSNKKALYEWKVNGKPQDGPLKDQKKSTKAKLRGAQRCEIALQRNMNMEEIMNAQLRDSKTFYKLVNSYRKRRSVQIEELIVGDETYTTPENILEGWKKHFETLATPAENDTKNYTNTEFDLDLIYEICTEMNNELTFSEKEIEEAIRSLNSKKTPDVYGLTAEHLKYGGIVHLSIT